MAEIVARTAMRAPVRAGLRAALRAALVLGTCTLGSVAVAPALAASGDAAPAVAQKQAWSSLTPPEQQALAPLRDQWAQLLPGQQQRFLRIAARWQDAAPAKRAAIEQRIANWVAMTPDERAQLRARYKKFRDLPPEQQQDLRDAFQHFRDLPPDQRQALRERFDRMTPAERETMLAKAASEPSRPVWQRVFAEVPPEQRAPMRAMWLELDRDQRHALHRHAQTLSIAERTALRSGLLAMTPGDPKPSP